MQVLLKNQHIQCANNFGLKLTRLKSCSPGCYPMCFPHGAHIKAFSIMSANRFCSWSLQAFLLYWAVCIQVSRYCLATLTFTVWIVPVFAQYDQCFFAPRVSSQLSRTQTRSPRGLSTECRRATSSSECEAQCCLGNNSRNSS